MAQADSAAWRVLLVHTSEQLDQHVVCKLLSCSNAMAVTVHETCSGRLKVRYRTAMQSKSEQQQLQQLAADSRRLASWLSKHEALLSEFSVHLQPGSGGRQDQRQEQQHQQEGLHVESHDLRMPQAGHPSTWQPMLYTQQFNVGPLKVLSAAAGLFQQLWRLLPIASATLPVQGLQLASRTLTSLDWTLSSSEDPQALMRVLPGLQSLRKLGLHCIDTGTGTASLEGLASGLQPLTQLTSLSLQHFSISASSSRMLPTSLTELQIGPPLPRIQQAAADVQSSDAHYPEPLHLQHLTQLQRLQLHSLDACCKLPEGLAVLHVGSCSAHAVVHLKQLQVLRVDEDAPELLLLLLETLKFPRLRDVQLTCRGTWLSPSSFKHLEKLPLTHLRVREELPHQLLPLLGHCTQLTSLSLQLKAVEAATQQLMSQQLLHMTALQALELSMQAPSEQDLLDIAAVVLGPWPYPDAMEGHAAVQAADELVAALQGLPQLQDMQLHGVQVTQQQQSQLWTTLRAAGPAGRLQVL
jgi:hypothetical protein